MFDRSLLPPAETFYRSEFSRMTRPSRGWVQVRCCFHDDKTPSLSLNLREGNFFCHGCGQKGGDILDFLMARDGVSFRRACERLRAWTDGSAESSHKLQHDRRKYERQRERLERARQHIETEVKRLRFGLLDHLHALDQIQHQVSSRLNHHPAEDIYWHILSLLPDEKRKAEAAYRLLSFGSAADRVRYVTAEDSREPMIDAVLWSGTLRTDDGKVIEIPL